MLNGLQLANELQVCVVAIVWSLVVFKLLPTYRLDSFRQKMFAVRDELFDYAAEGHISFEDPAYMLLRRQMNGLIRYGHQITLYRSLVSWFIKRAAANANISSWHASFEHSLEAIPEESVRNKVKQFHERSVVLTAKHLISGSPTLWIALLLSAFGIVATGAALGLRQLLKAAASKVLRGPFDQRLIEEQAVEIYAC